MVDFKVPSQGEDEGEEKYGKPNINLGIPPFNKTEEPKEPTDNSQEQKIEYEPYILNLDKELIKTIETFISEKKNEGVRLYDLKTKKLKKINKSLWAREVLVAALEKEGFYRKK